MTLEESEELAVLLDSFEHDPLGFVETMFQWGVGELEGQKIEDWQRAFLDRLGKKLRSGRVKQGDVWRYVAGAIRRAIASGHGIGKSALVSWLILWALATKEDTMGVVTANTAGQLAAKTWAQLGKWHRMFLGAHLFTYTATAIYSADPKHEKTWRVDAIPWTEHKSEAFAGLHNKGKRIIVIFDEASAISDKISEVTEGALTDDNTEIMWFKFGNPTRNTGNFADCFTKHRHLWEPLQIDSRTVAITNKKQIEEWIETYGEDSDFVRIRVRGIFPKRGDRQFFSADLIEQARQRGLTMTPPRNNYYPSVISLDSAWTGVDEIACGHKLGLFVKIAWVQAKNDDDVILATRFAQTEDELKADAAFIDFGYGTGVYSVGKHMNRKWQLIQFGGAALNPKKHKNKRAEMYDTFRTFMKEGGAVADDPKFLAELAAIEEVYRDDGVIQLERKEDFIQREGYSPGRADAGALLFAAPVKPKSEEERAGLPQRSKKVEYARPREYDPYEENR